MPAETQCRCKTHCCDGSSPSSCALAPTEAFCSEHANLQERLTPRSLFRSPRHCFGRSTLNYPQFMLTCIFLTWVSFHFCFKVLFQRKKQSIFHSSTLCLFLNSSPVFLSWHRTFTAPAAVPSLTATNAIWYFPCSTAVMHFL